MVNKSNIIEYELPEPLPLTWQASARKILGHEHYQSASVQRGFSETGKDYYRYTGKLNHLISHHFVAKFHKENNIDIDVEEVWNRPDYYDVKLPTGDIVQIKSKADRGGFFSMDWALEVPEDHFDKYKQNQNFGIIYGSTDFKNKKYRIIGFLTLEEFDEIKQIADIGTTFRDGFTKSQGGKNYYAYPESWKSMNDYLKMISEN